METTIINKCNNISITTAAIATAEIDINEGINEGINLETGALEENKVHQENHFLHHDSWLYVLYAFFSLVFLITTIGPIYYLVKKLEKNVFGCRLCKKKDCTEKYMQASMVFLAGFSVEMLIVMNILMTVPCRNEM